MAERIAVGRLGWCRVAIDDPSVQVKVRFAETATGRLAIAELVVARFPGVSADSLRAVPVGRIEAWANGPGRDTLVGAIGERAGLADADTAVLDAHERAEADQRARWGTSPEAAAAQDRLLDEAARLGVAEQLDAGLVAIGAGGVVSETPLRSRVRSLRLRVPVGQPKPDSFYREVGRVYSEVGLNTGRPAAAIAEANGVPVSTVHGWVKEARRRGLLAPGERQPRRQQ